MVPIDPPRGRWYARTLMEHLYREAFRLALEAETPVLIAHAKPDGDTVGALLAFGNALEAAGKRHLRYCRDPLPKQYAFLAGAETVTSDEEAVAAARPDLAVVFDSGDLRYAGAEALVARLGSPRIVNIDHHPSNARYGQLNLVEPRASSTSEIVHSILSASGVRIDREIATCLMTGICFDTSTFSNPATTAMAMTVGADLLRRGAKFPSVLRNVVRNKPVPLLRLWGVALSRLEHYRGFDAATTAITQADMEAVGADEEMTGGVTNFLNAFLDVPTVLLMIELPGGRVKVSMRTSGEMDLSKVAAGFGGGGHKKAAGFTIPGRLVERGGGHYLESQVPVSTRTT